MPEEKHQQTAVTQKVLILPTGTINAIIMQTKKFLFLVPTLTLFCHSR